MPSSTYHQPDGSSRTIELTGSGRVMQTALASGIPGMIGECGGQAMCATCHVYVREDYLDGLPEISEAEDEMLEVTAALRDDERSRLSCQILVGEGIDHVEVDIPETQV